MQKLKFELFVTVNNKQEFFVLDDKPVVMGTTRDCDILVTDGDPPVKVVFKIEDNAISVKVFDLKYPVKINGKKYKSAKLTDSLFFKVGAYDVILSVEKIHIAEDIDPTSTEISELIEEEFDQTSITSLDDLAKEESIQTTQLDSEPVSVSMDGDVDHLSKKEELPEQRETQQDFEGETKDYNDVFSFKTVFDESKFVPLGFEPYSHPKLSFEDYIDTVDETLTVLPSQPIYEEKKGYSVHVIHMNNGTVLSEEFYSTKFKRLFVTEFYSKKNYFQVLGSDFEKEELAFIKGNHVSAVKLDGFRLAKISNGKAFEVSEKTVQIIPGEKAILTKGTTQIVIQLSMATPSVQPKDYFDFDEDLLKALAYAWCFMFFFILNAVLIDKKEEEKKRVVIYKRVEVQKPQEKEAAKTLAEVDTPKIEQEMPKKAEVPQPVPQEKVVKKVEKKPEKKVAKKAPPKKKPVKKVVNRPPVSKQQKVAEKVAKAAPKPKPKKSYKFNFASKMSSSLASTSPAKLKTAQTAGAVDVASSMSSSTKVTSDLSAKNMGMAKTKVARFAAGSVSGKTKMLGTKGLSGKTKSNTAYIQAKTKVLGALDPGLIRKIMREFIPQFRRCYQKELLRNPDVAGVFDLNFQINKVGVGKNTRVKSNGKGFSPAGKSCIKRVVKMIKFPRPKGGGYVDVRQPMNFYANQ